MTTPWHMARVASRRELPKPRKMHGPVGPAALLRPADGNNWTDAIREVGDSPDYPSRVNLGRTCKRCGVHVCSCDPYALYHSLRANHPEYTLRAYYYAKKGSMHFVQSWGGTPNVVLICPQDIPPEYREPVEPPHPVVTSANVPRGHAFFVQDTRPGSVDVAGLENLRAEWQRDRDEMCTCGCGYSKTTCNYVRYHEAAFKAMSSPNSVARGEKDREF